MSTEVLEKGLPSLSPATRYAVRAQAVDAQGNKSDWSEVLDFTTITDTSGAIPAVDDAIATIEGTLSSLTLPFYSETFTPKWNEKIVGLALELTTTVGQSDTTGDTTVSVYKNGSDTPFGTITLPAGQRYINTAFTPVSFIGRSDYWQVALTEVDSAVTTLTFHLERTR